MLKQFGKLTLITSFRSIVVILLACITVVYSFNATQQYEIVNGKYFAGSVICFGDSLTYGTGASPGMDYPSQLSRLTGLSVVNLGKPGDTSSSALKRVDQVLTQNPDVVLITLGGNDLKNGVPVDQAFNNMKEIVKRLQSRGAMVVIGGIQIPFLDRGYAKRYEVLARETGSVLVENVFDGIMGNAGMMSDRIHPNDAGYRIMAQHFLSAIEPYWHQPQ